MLLLHCISVTRPPPTTGIDSTKVVLSSLLRPTAAALIFLWSIDLNTAEIIISIILSAYIVVGAALEERKLTLEFGSEYSRYQNEASMLMPLKWLMGKRSR
jgi:hypothetical protein